MINTDELHDYVATLAEEHDVPGVAIGIYLDGEESYLFHGVTSIEHPLSVDEQTLFQIGSTTKTFTATAMMCLVEAGQVDLEAPVRTYVSELQLKDEETAARVTILHLLNHTAGWYGDYVKDTGLGDDALARFVASMAEIDQMLPLGSAVSYNNAAVRLAGRVIEKVTGKTYEAAVKDLVLDPLHLHHTFSLITDVISRRFAVGHRRHEGQVEVVRPWHLPRSSAPSGGICATASDQIQYARFHLGDGTTPYGGRLLREETLRVMQSPTFKLGRAPGEEVGISWFIRHIEGVRMIGHGGTTRGQTSAFQMVPERDFAITVLTNAELGGRLHREIVPWSLERYLGIKQAQPEPINLTETALAEYTGVYRSPMGKLTMVVEDSHLVGTLAYDPKVVASNPAARPEPMTLAMLAGDTFLIAGGDSKGLKGSFQRREGNIQMVELGGRLLLKTNEASGS